MTQSSTQRPLIDITPRVKLRPRSAPDAAFLSALIAGRRNLAQAPGSPAGRVEASNAYAATSRIAVRRMPLGYRRTVVA